MDREELIAIITAQAREGRGWACRTMLELLETEPVLNAEQQAARERILKLVAPP
jgi:hypothetical protein